MAMGKKWVFAVTAVLVLLASFGLHQIETESRAARVHQHRQAAWQPAAGSEAEGSTHLPIVCIETDGRKVPGTPIVNGHEITFETAENGEETVVAAFALIDGQEGANRVTDQPAVSSQARIRYRGNSSRFFDKKSYSVHLVDAQGKENPQELAGMAAHDEWVLNGPFLDRTLLRNYLCLNLAGEIMEYAPNVRYCELYLDGAYQGLYLLMESVSKGQGRINLPKPERNSAVTSYIVRWDRTGKGDHELDNYTFYTYRGDVSSLDVRYPGNEQITEQRMQYIEDDVSRIEKTLYSYDLTAASDFIDLNSFAEYFVINELFRNVDAGRFSTFYYKNTRGKLKACVWDFNNGCDNYIDYQWDEAGFTMQDAPWFGQLLKDKRFVGLVVAKYRQLRSGLLSEHSLLSYLDETLAWLGDEVDRNNEKWGYVFDLSQYNGMNYLTPVERNDASYEQAVARLKQFLIDRGRWLDEHIETLYQYCHASKTVNETTR